MLTEEIKISCAAGEFIHSIGNRMVDNAISRPHCDKAGEILVELGSILMTRNIDCGSYPTLKSMNFNPSNYKRSQLADLASWILDSEKSFDDCVKAMTAN